MGVGLAAKGVGVAVLLGAPFVVHLAGDVSDAAGIVVSLQAFCLAWVMLGTLARRPRSIMALAAAAATGLLWRELGAIFAVAATHAVSYLALLAIFMASLAPGREPVVTRMAARLRGPLPDVLIHYTRGVTILWCGFFLAQVLVSATLGILVALGWIGTVWWRDFVTLWNLPLVMALFVVEFAYHSWRFAALNPTGLVDVVRAARGIGGAGKG